jgi:cell wall-associated NlpC family hydrolase
MGRVRLALVLGAFGYALLLFPLGSYARSNANTWTGIWSSNWGTMTLTQSGSSVTGTYTHDQGKIKGTLNGDVVTGTWSEAPTRKGPMDAGDFEFTLQGGKSFTGKWRYARAGDSWRSDWTGSCTAGACLRNGSSAGVSAAPTAAKMEAALAWATDQLGSTRWGGRCERFVEAAYGARAAYGSAAVAAKKLRLRQGPIGAVPAGALVYFQSNCPGATGKYGHAGISLGGGRMISPGHEVRVIDVRKSAVLREAYIGWAYPPAGWPGREP